MNSDDGFGLQRPELVAFVLANLFMLAMTELRRANTQLSDTILDNAEDKVGTMCKQLLVPVRDQKSIDKLFVGIREMAAIKLN